MAVKKVPGHLPHKMCHSPLVAKRCLGSETVRMIDMADEVYIINVGGYIGSSTRSEIEYAEAQGKPVHYLEQ